MKRTMLFLVDKKTSLCLWTDNWLKYCVVSKNQYPLLTTELVITSHPGQIVKHGDIKCVLNEVMPIFHRAFEKHHLIIKFKVNFPENGFLSHDKLSQLGKLLPDRKEIEEIDEMDQVRTLIHIRKDSTVTMEKQMFSAKLHKRTNE